VEGQSFVLEVLVVTAVKILINALILTMFANAFLLVVAKSGVPLRAVLIYVLLLPVSKELAIPTMKYVNALMVDALTLYQMTVNVV
jgi:hypothetical protein